MDDHPFDPLGTRCQEDLHLRDAMAAEGYSGPRFEKFRDDTLKHGLATAQLRIASSHVFTDLRRLPKPIDLNEPHWVCTRLRRDPAAAHDLAIDCTVNGWEKFLRDGLKGGRWDPRKGASMRTYCKTQILYCFPDAYRRWMRENRPPSMTIDWDSLPETDFPDVSVIDVAATAMLERLLLTQGARTLSADERAFLHYKLTGHTHKEIADLMDRSVRSVEYLHSKVKRALRRSLTG